MLNELIKYTQRSLLVLLTLWLGGQEALAQCSQCKAAAGTTDENGSYLFGQNINTGVLYLLAMPLLLPFIAGGVWYYKVRTRRRQQELEASLSHRSVNQFMTDAD